MKQFWINGATGLGALCVFFAAGLAWADDGSTVSCQAQAITWLLAAGFCGIAAALYFMWTVAEISTLRAERNRLMKAGDINALRRLG